MMVRRSRIDDHYGPLRTFSRWFIGLTGWLFFLTGTAGASEPTQVSAPATAISADDLDFFEQQVRPLLIAHCLDCHSSDSDPPEGGLRLDSRDGWLAGGELGSPIVPGEPDRSLLIEAVEQKSDRLRMPPDNRLSAQEVAVLREWIARGAPDPRQADTGEATGETTAPQPAKVAIDPEQGRQFWAFRPLQTVRPDARAAGRYAARAVNGIDLLLMAHWDPQQLTPAGTADRGALVRRVTLDLTGLPPTAAEVQTFLADARPDAYERLVDRLLASPRYGQRWGRFWLDVARYADSNGLDENIAHGNAWRYRDYVIASWNHDKPFDTFVLEQLAGDLLPPTTDEAIRQERLIATGFLVLGPKVLAEVDETKMEMDIIDEQVETVGRAFLGLTLGCARCHDHKFDPISQRDYYGLAGIFKSTRTMEHFKKIARWNEVTLATADQQAAHQAAQAELAAQQGQLQTLMAELQASNSGAGSGGGATVGGATPGATDEPRASLQQRVEKLQQEVTARQQAIQELPFAMAVSDQPQPVSLPVHIRGNHLTLGEQVPRRFPEVLVHDTFPSPELPNAQSGRRELAEWLVDPRHPLTARVLVNRLWRWHFGRGLVASTDNFGKLGETPSHPELLDWLAGRLITSGWSIKRLQRELVLSHVYQLASSVPPAEATTETTMAWNANMQRDPENRFYWRGPLRRLEAEAIRDSLLAVSGQLDESMGGSLLHVKNREFLFDHTSKDNTRYDAPRRSVYLPVIRNHLYDMFQLFDYVDDSVTSSDRATTTVAPQALFLMNGELAQQCATELAERLAQDHPADFDGRLEAAYWRIFGRAPTSDERQRDQQYLQRLVQGLSQAGIAPDQCEPRAWALLCQAWLASNEFVYVR